MSAATRWLGLVMTVAMFVRGAVAQDLPLPDRGMGSGGYGMPEELALPGDDEFGPYAADGMPAEEGSLLLGPSTGASGSFDANALPGLEPVDDYCDYQAGPQDWWDNYTAPIESTGTWLRRGFWFAEAEAVVWNRMWNRDSKFFAAQDPNVLNPQFFFQQPLSGINQPRPANFNTNRLLMVDGSQPGEDASVRVKLGHFLFRDSKNRDHMAEFTAMGGGTWHQHRVLSSEQPFGLFVPFYISGNNRTFNASTTQVVDYSSHYSNFEANYHVKSRMRRDQLVMDANGQWHRAANASFTRDYLVGLRMMEMRDILNWSAEDIEVIGDDGSYNIRTDNDLFGVQFGAGITYEASRWSLGTSSRMGFYVNDALGRTTLNFTADDDNDADLRMSNDEMSWIVDVNVTGRYHLTPNFSLRASYELMYLTSLALAPYQATFITNFSYLNTSGDALYHGMSFGFEGYW